MNNSILSQSERETIITFSDDSDLATIYTTNKSIIKHLKLHKFAQNLHESYCKGNLVGLECQVPKTCIILAKKPRKRMKI